MPNLSKHQSSEFTKLLLMGDSKSGKTGALASLVLAGYKLRILDFDNGLEIYWLPSSAAKSHRSSRTSNFAPYAISMSRVLLAR